MEKKVLYFFFHLLFSMFFYFIVKRMVEVLGNMYSITPILLSFIYFIGGILIIWKKYFPALILYLIGVIVFLLFRKIHEEVRFSYENYLYKWLKIYFVNKIVFYNISGNVILFIPLILFLNYYIEGRMLYNIVISFLIIIAFELMQLILKRGVFDIVDIYLNMTGVILGSIFWKISIEVKKWIKMKKNIRVPKITKKNL